MNWDQVQGNWKQLKGRARQMWADLTDDDLENIAGKRQELAGRLQAKYGLAKDKVEQQIDEWIGTL